MASQKTLVTGATGLVGSHIAELLVSRGTPVRALVRPASDTGFLGSLGVELVEGDMRDRASLGRACESVDTVYHVAAKLGEWGSRQEFVDLNVGAVAALMDASAEAGVRRLVHVSSVAVYGRVERAGITEDTPQVATGHPYMDTKAEGEMVAVSEGRRRGVEVAVVRPSMVYGPRDRNFLPHLVKNLKRGRMAIIGSGTHQANTVYAGTVAEICQVLATHPRAAFEAFNVMDPDPLSWRELLTAIALRVGCPAPHMAVPKQVAYAVGGMMEIAARAIGSRKPPPMTRFVAGALGFDLSYSAKKAENVVGFVPRVTVRQGIERSVPAAA